jgi:hypothetical protein
VTCPGSGAEGGAGSGHITKQSDQGQSAASAARGSGGCIPPSAIPDSNLHREALPDGSLVVPPAPGQQSP